MSINPPAAVKAAYSYLIEMAGTESSKYSNFRVEEAKLDKDGNYLITLSYEYAGDFPFDKKREFKDFVIDYRDGRVISMTIRKI